MRGKLELEPSLTLADNRNKLNASDLFLFAHFLNDRLQEMIHLLSLKGYKCNFLTVSNFSRDLLQERMTVRAALDLLTPVLPFGFQTAECVRVVGRRASDYPTEPTANEIKLNLDPVFLQLINVLRCAV